MDKETKVKYVSWSTIQEILKILAKRISKNYEPEVIIAIAKGGLVPARILADLLGVGEMGFIEVKFYKGVAIRGEKPFIKSIALPQIRDKKVLVVDDVVDSGRTIQLVIDTLAVHAPLAVRSTALYVKPWSTYFPDYFYAVTDEWIVFPWEICEAIREGVFVSNSEFINESRYCHATNSD